MPQFDYTKRTPQGQVQASGPLDQGTGIRVQTANNLAQGMNQIATDVEGIARQRVTEQAKSDMSAFQADRIKREQIFREKAATITNDEEYKKAVDKYITDLNKHAAGKRQDGTKVFRNGMGSAAYKEFNQNYSAQFKAAGADHAFQLGRKRDKLNYRMAINSGIENNTPNAIDQSIKASVDSGLMSPEEGTIERKKAHKARTINSFQQQIATMTLGAEDLLLQSTDLKQTTETISNRLEVFKAEVYANKNLDETERVYLLNSAKSAMTNTQRASKAAKKEREIESEKEQFAYENDYMQEVIEGNQTYSSIFSNPNISEKFKRGKLAAYGAKVESYNKIIQKENKTLKEKIEAKELQLGYDIANSNLTNIALRYDSSRDDAQGTKKAALLNDIYTSVGMESQYKTYLANVVKGSESMPSHIKSSRDIHLKDMNRIFGLTKESFEAYKYNPWGSAGPKSKIDKTTGIKTVDGLAEFDRRKAVNSALIQYDSLIKEGKEDKAEDFISNFKTEYEKSQDDIQLYNSFFTEKIKYR